MADERWIFAVVERDIAEELLHETYIVCVDTFSRTHPGRPFECAYFRTSLRRRMRRELHDRGRRELLEVDFPAPGSPYDRVDDHDAAVRVLRSLPEPSRTAMVLAAAGWTRREIAEATGRTETAVNGAMARGRAAVRHALAAAAATSEEDVR